MILDGEKAIKQGRFHDAKKIFLKLIENNEENFLIHWYLGHVFFKLHNYSKASKHIINSIKLNKEDSLNLNFLGQIYLQKNQHQEAIKLFNRALILNENDQEALKNLALANLQIGKLELAKKYYDILWKKFPKNLGYYYALNNLDEKLSIENVKLKEVKNLNHNKIYLNLILAKKSKLIKNYDDEIKYLLEAHGIFNELKKSQSLQQYNYYTNHLPTLLKELQKINHSSNNIFKPIFILGLPRSGTTLMETIINSGTNVIQSMGEADCFDKVFFSNQLMNYDGSNSKKNFEFTKEKLSLLEKAILKQYYEQGLKENTQIFTDKSITNILYVDLIKKIFPSAKFIYCKRNIIANVIGMLRAFLPDVYWTHSLNQIKAMIDINFKNLKRAKKEFNHDLLEIDLENLSGDPIQYSKKIFNFLELNWSEKILSANNNLIIKTASNVQVRQKIYKHDNEHVKYFEKIFKKIGYNFS